MPNNLKNYIPAVLFICVSTATSAQEVTVSSRTPRFVSEKGYWVIRSNVKQPKEAVVYFYNLQHELVYEEEVKNARLNINRIKVKMRLKKALEQAIAVHEREGTTSKDDKILASVFRKK
ncbi:hypothetical protein [Lacibacter sediminis]|uniref:Uncharacterized protein n=1 Tax=Lacibacter sediminis TaxID=2760713 RepID=A0A7G5XFB8_9BACT|nr:hypothetical protein [Lacibacter sediminis]QNA44171.1 hypothetical protein H4075_19185 [Lacibacter sediminis]